jgi:hypothetical protein
MRRVMLLALVALALPTVVVADVLSTGTFIPTTGNCPSPTCRSTVQRDSTGGFAAGNFQAQVAGTALTIQISTGTLHAGTSGLTTGCVIGTLPTGMCTFLTGIVDIHPGTPGVIRLPVIDGAVTKTTTTATITALLVPSSTTAAMGLGPGVVFNIDFAPCTGCPPAPANINRLLSGTALVGTPEPGTLCLLGTSVIGLAGMARRRLRLGK